MDPIERCKVSTPTSGSNVRFAKQVFIQASANDRMKPSVSDDPIGATGTMQKRRKSNRSTLPLDVDDFREKTAMLTAEETGAYIQLLTYSWQNTGRLPDRDRALANICSVTASRWKKHIRPAIEDLFVIQEGEWRDPQIEAKLDWREELSAKRSAAAKSRHDPPCDDAFLREEFRKLFME